MQALSDGQSEFIKHSGLQLGGDPVISGRQEHLQSPLIVCGGYEFGPQGFGSQGSRSSITGSIAKTI